MTQARAIGGRLRVAAIAAFPLLSGCVAAALMPVAASSSAIVKKRMDEKRTTPRVPSAPARQTGGVPPTTVTAPDGATWRILSGAKGLPPPSGVTAATQSAPAPTAAAGTVPETMQYLYGSGEGAGASIQAYRAL